MPTKRLTTAALLMGLALVLFVIELQIPSPIPIPGVKLGLANIITVYALFVLTPLDAFLILCGRILLGAMFSGQMMALMYSFAGGLLCFLAMLLLRHILTENQIWACSAIGAVFHNIGQILIAILVTKSTAVIWYLPILLISGVLTGLFTGLCAQYVIHHMAALRHH